MDEIRAELAEAAEPAIERALASLPEDFQGLWLNRSLAAFVIVSG